MQKTAVIVGGSISGLLAATVLSPYFSRVIIFDRDTLADAKHPRKGTAQAPHAHILLQRGLLGLEHLLPGFIDILREAGAMSTSATNDWQSLFPKGFMARFESDIQLLCQSRYLLEQTLRSHVLDKLSNLEVIDSASVNDVQLASNENPTIHYTLNQHTHSQQANLVVDCTGRNSKAPLYLEKQDFGQVPRKSISPYLGYASRLYKNISLPDQYRTTLIMANDPAETRGGVVLPIENNQHIVTLFGFSKDYPPSDALAFKAFAKNLRADTIYNAIKDADPISEIKQFIKNESHFHQYHKMKQWPKGFLTLGDSITSFNPIYGQGITSATIAAEKLKSLLNEASIFDNQQCKKIQTKLCQSYQLPWIISQNEDLRWPKTTGMKAGVILKMMHRFSDAVSQAGTKDRDVTYAYYSILHMTKLPTALLHPKILFKIFKHGLRKT